MLGFDSLCADQLPNKGKRRKAAWGEQRTFRKDQGPLEPGDSSAERLDGASVACDTVHMGRCQHPLSPVFRAPLPWLMNLREGVTACERFFLEDLFAGSSEKPLPAFVDFPLSSVRDHPWACMAHVDVLHRE